jgi:putative transposase
VIAYIDAHRDRFGVEPICTALQFAPSTHWSAKRRPPSVRVVRDEELKAHIARVHAENFGVYGERAGSQARAPRRLRQVGAWDRV